MDLGLPEILVILVLALLLFGPSKLPGLGKSMGEAIRGFKKGLKDDGEDKTAHQDPHQQIQHNGQKTDTAQSTQTERTPKS